MCRNIRVLFHFQPPTTDDEIRAAALQYVRKVAGTTKPSRANAAAFEAAVDELAALTQRLIHGGLVPAGPPRTREREAVKAKQRGLRRDLRTGGPPGSAGPPAPTEPAASPAEAPPTSDAAVTMDGCAPPDGDRVYFVPYEIAGPRADAAFEVWRMTILRLLPGSPSSPEVHHVGATSIPGSWTKGDLDVCVRVSMEQFPAADEVLARNFARNVGSTHTSTYSSFKDDGAEPQLGIQLVVAGGPEDFFLRLRDRLRTDGALVERLNTLRLRHEGGDMASYRDEKGEFYEIVLGGGGDWS